jgi:tetratricopeptide (TPR) repeat protein
MNTAARWWPLWLLSLALISAETSGQETLWETYKAAGNKAFQQARSAEAERLFLAAIEQAEKLGKGKHDPRLAESLNNLAVLYATQGKQVEAEPLFRRALEINAQVFGPEHPEVAASLEVFAALLRTTHRGTEAEKLETRAKEIRARQAQANSSD